MNSKEFQKEFIELFAFLITQEIARNTPVDTGRLKNSFIATMKVEGNKIIWTLPYYFEFLEWGTVKMAPRFFVRNTLEKSVDIIAEKVLKIMIK